MSEFEWIVTALTVFSVLLLPTLAIMLRGAIKWTRTEDKLGTLVEDMRELMADKDRTHQEILAQMRVDRDATDKRLRFIEEFWMLRGREHYSNST